MSDDHVLLKLIEIAGSVGEMSGKIDTVSSRLDELTLRVRGNGIEGKLQKVDDRVDIVEKWVATHPSTCAFMENENESKEERKERLSLQERRRFDFRQLWIAGVVTLFFTALTTISLRTISMKMDAIERRATAEHTTIEDKR